MHTPVPRIMDSDNTPYKKIGDEVRSLADEVPFDIPDSWEWMRLGQIVFNHGQCTPHEDFCYIDIGSINNKSQCLNNEETVLSADKVPSRARKIVTIGDILYSTVRPYLHNMCIIDRSFSLTPIASTGFAVMTCHSDLYNKYLFYYLMSPNFDAYANDTDNAKGVAYPAHSSAGNGLGLPLVQRIVQLSGGNIHVSSQLGLGTTFTVTLPIAKKTAISS